MLVDPNTVLHNSVMAKLSGKDASEAKFFVGQKVKLLEDVKNDGTYPYLPIGAVMIDKGAIGYIRHVGEFLQVIRVYEVHFMDERAAIEIVGCREHELEALEPYRDIEAEEAAYLENYYKNKS
ncbi:MAG: nitrogen fixation protein NifZ [Sulfurospirillaceae bacterium]|nr:nitrogen fixation protein NifZ [Sulfurospirillaceae bacterium]